MNVVGIVAAAAAAAGNASSYVVEFLPRSSSRPGLESQRVRTVVMFVQNRVTSRSKQATIPLTRPCPFDLSLYRLLLVTFLPSSS